MIEKNMMNENGLARKKMNKFLNFRLENFN